LELNRNYRTCAKHFEDSQFINENHNSLIWNSVPTLFEVPNQPAKITPSRRVITRHESASVACASSGNAFQSDPADVVCHSEGNYANTANTGCDTEPQ